MIHPIPPPIRITQRFGPSTAGLFYKFHYGIDYGAPHWTPVLAPEPGKPTRIGRGLLTGKYIDFRGQSGALHRFFHLSANDAQVGKEYAEGDIVGRVGSTGYSTGNHLHWEVILNGKQVDPLWWLGQEGEETVDDKQFHEIAVNIARAFRDKAYGQGAAHPDAEKDAAYIKQMAAKHGKLDWAIADWIRQQFTQADWSSYWQKKF